MAIQAGQIIHDAHGFVIDRIQTGGVSNLNIPQEKVYELGNYLSVATVRDTPDLSFDLESFDVSTEIEAVNNFVDPTTTVSGDLFDPIDAVPLDIITPIKSAKGLFDATNGLIIPYLTLESSTYNFGVSNNATQQHTYKGDSVFFVDGGSPYYEEFAGTGGNGPFALAHTAKVYNYSGDAVHVVALCVVYSDGTYKRLKFGDDYTDTTTTFTLTDGATTAPSGSTIRACYGSATVASYPQSVHQNVSVKPAAVRGKDIDVYVGSSDATPVFTRWDSVQSFQVTRKVSLDADKEFGNPQNVSQDYDVPDVSGSITLKPRNVDTLFDKIYQVGNITAGEIGGPLTSVGLPLELRINDPDSGVRVKTLYIPDVRFTVPNIQGKVQQKQEVTFNFSSDGGSLYVYKGNRYGT